MLYLGEPEGSDVRASYRCIIARWRLFSNSLFLPIDPMRCPCTLVRFPFVRRHRSFLLLPRDVSTEVKE